MKTEKQIIDSLGEWLCLDMEKSLAKSIDPRLPFPTESANGRLIIRDVAERIRFYRDNCLTNK